MMSLLKKYIYILYKFKNEIKTINNKTVLNKIKSNIDIKKVLNYKI